MEREVRAKGEAGRGPAKGRLTTSPGCHCPGALADKGSRWTGWRGQGVVTVPGSEWGSITESCSVVRLYCTHARDCSRGQESKPSGWKGHANAPPWSAKL